MVMHYKNVCINVGYMIDGVYIDRYITKVTMYYMGLIS